MSPVRKVVVMFTMFLCKEWVINGTAKLAGVYGGCDKNKSATRLVVYTYAQDNEISLEVEAF